MYGRSIRDPERKKACFGHGSESASLSSSQSSASGPFGRASEPEGLGSQLYDATHRREEYKGELEPLIQELTTGVNPDNVTQIQLVVTIFDKLLRKAKSKLEWIDQQRENALTVSGTAKLPTKRPVRSKADRERALQFINTRRQILGYIDTLTTDKAKFNQILASVDRPKVFERRVQAVWTGMMENPLYGPER